MSYFVSWAPGISISGRRPLLLAFHCDTDPESVLVVQHDEEKESFERDIEFLMSVGGQLS